MRPPDFPPGYDPSSIIIPGDNEGTPYTHYDMKYRCSNCGQFVWVAIKKGVTAPSRLKDKECSNCGCATLVCVERP